MGFEELYIFLEKLQKNNSKDWMDNHRSEYHDVRDFYIGWLQDLNNALAAIDDDYFDTPGKKAINRINNNLMFHPNRPVYKDHFGAGLDQVSKQGDFYIELGVDGSYIGGGYWHPSSKIIKSIRDAIDYNGSELVEILQKDSFKLLFGDMIVDSPLKTAPKGFSIDHPNIDLLRRRSFAVVKELSKKEIMSSGFKEMAVEVYKEMLPFRRYLNEAITV